MAHDVGIGGRQVGSAAAALLRRTQPRNVARKRKTGSCRDVAGDIGRDDRPDWEDPDDFAGSRIPRRPYGGAGAAGAEAEPDAQVEGEGQLAAGRGSSASVLSSDAS